MYALRQRFLLRHALCTHVDLVHNTEIKKSPGRVFEAVFAVYERSEIRKQFSLVDAEMLDMEVY